MYMIRNKNNECIQCRPKWSSRVLIIALGLIYSLFLWGYVYES